MKAVLQELLVSKGLKYKSKTIQNFLTTVDEVAPWFAVSGNLTLACWDKLGKDLDRAWEEGSLQDRAGKTGVRGLWKVIRSCLTCESCLPAIQATAEALEQVKEACSDTRSDKSQEPPSKPPRLYPSLKGIEEKQGSEADGSSDSELDMEDLEEAIQELLAEVERRKRKRRKKSETRS